MFLKKNIKNILREGIAPSDGIDNKLKPNPDTPMEEAEKGSDSGDDNASDEDYVEISNKLLRNDIINHSAIMRRMSGVGNWGQADDNERGLFEKKLKRNKNDGGGTYRFTRQEAQKIKDILNDPYKSSKKIKKKA